MHSYMAVKSVMKTYLQIDLIFLFPLHHIEWDNREKCNWQQKILYVVLWQ
jgi:hypothetical protein